MFEVGQRVRVVVIHLSVRNPRLERDLIGKVGEVEEITDKFVVVRLDDFPRCPEFPFYESELELVKEEGS